MTYKGCDVFDMSVPRSGISYSPELEWLLAAHWGMLSEKQFFELPGEEQSYIVAGYRCYNQMEAVLANEQRKDTQRQQKNPSGKGGHQAKRKR